ncbi:PepSY-like domain-containing protein [Larkinella sp.]|uniref:PepSY-like domain-containing protein n=1 Tax=Larkinella sp. TaxID=2034517 RepID=UPI003BAD3409
MKKPLFIALTVIVAGLYGCNQSQQTVTPDTDSAISATSTARLASDSSGFFCRKNITKIAVTDLPTSVSNYLSTNYAGATVDYAAKDDTGNFLVAITQNGETKALLFNADGTFNEELALKGGPGRKGGSHGKGGGKKGSLEQIAVADLPSAITSYISTNYAGAEVKTAAKDSTRGYLVMIVVSDQAKTLLFNTDGTFNKEVSKPLRGNFTSVAVADLPAAVTTYITTTYAGSTIKDAAKNASGQLVVVVKTSDGKPVALLFEADGTFKQVLKQRR